MAIIADKREVSSAQEIRQGETLKRNYLFRALARLHYSIYINNENNKSYSNKLSFYCRIVKILDTYPGGWRVLSQLFMAVETGFLNSSASVVLLIELPFF